MVGFGLKAGWGGWCCGYLRDAPLESTGILDCHACVFLSPLPLDQDDMTPIAGIPTN